MNKKIINNAISAYFGMSLLLLFPSKKENINHPFVKKHAKTAIVIHILMMVTYILFISFRLFAHINFAGFYLHRILASVIFLGLFGWLLYGVFKASKGEEFHVTDMQRMTKTENILQIKNSQLNEKGIFTIILSLIPFIGFITRGKFYNYKSPIIEENIKLNFLFTLALTVIYVSGYDTAASFVLLIWCIFLGFYSVLVITKQSVMTFHLSKIPTLENLSLLLKTALIYSVGYFKDKDFKNFQVIYQEKLLSHQETKKQNLEMLSQKHEAKLPAYLYYIPYINIIGLIDIRSKYHFHIINGLLITILCVGIYFVGHPTRYLYILFFIFFGFGYTKHLNYQFPLLFDIYLGGAYIFKKVFFIGKRAHTLQKTKDEVVYTINPELTQKQKDTIQDK